MCRSNLGDRTLPDKPCLLYTEGDQSSTQETRRADARPSCPAPAWSGRNARPTSRLLIQRLRQVGRAFLPVQRGGRARLPALRRDERSSLSLSSGRRPGNPARPACGSGGKAWMQLAAMAPKRIKGGSGRLASHVAPKRSKGGSGDWCSGKDLNLHDQKRSPGPQPGASAIPPPERGKQGSALYPTQPRISSVFTGRQN